MSAHENIAGTVQAKPHGYAPALVLGAVDKKFFCKECKHILRKPVQNQCGHRFCDSCLKEVSERLRNTGAERVYCPVCVEENKNAGELGDECVLEQIFPDNAIKRDIMKLEARCLNEGCDWKGPLRQYQDHESQCEHQKIECPNGCGVGIKVAERDIHMENQCPLRQVNCRYCEHRCAQSDIETHLLNCPSKPFTCKFCNTADILQTNEEAHYANACTAKTEKCTICYKRVLEGALTSHIEQTLAKHLLLLKKRTESAALATTQSLAVLDELTAVRDRVTELEAVYQQRTEGEAEKLQGAEGGAEGGADAPKGEKLEELSMKVSLFENIGSVLHEEILRLVQRVDKLETQAVGGGGGRIDSPDMQELLERVRILEITLQEREQKINELDLSVRNLDAACYDGALLWKVTEVSRRKSEARNGSVTSIYSSPFYTSKAGGYKMCARLYFNGDGMGRGTHLSLYFVVMRGDYDSLLKWPFRQKVTMSLLDFNRREHVSDVFRPDPSSTSFRRPVTVMNIASGCPLFCQLSVLDQTGPSQYVLDDTMFIKIVVDTSDMI